MVRCAAASAVCHFHRGAENRKKIMKRLSIPHRSYTSSLVHIKDKKKPCKADSQATTKEKKRRQGLSLVRTRREEAFREMEGITYEADGF